MRIQNPYISPGWLQLLWWEGEIAEIGLQAFPRLWKTAGDKDKWTSWKFGQEKKEGVGHEVEDSREKEQCR